MKIIAVTQARFSSSRLPGKVLLPLGKESALGLHLKRIRRSKKINDFIVATTEEKESSEIEKIALEHGFKVYHGSLNDVLDRFYKACADLQPDYVIRLTSDCPLIDPELIDDLVEKFLSSKVDYAANCLNPTLPDGMDAEIFSFMALKTAWMEATLPSEREHVTPYIRNSGKFKVSSIEYPYNWGGFRLTLDTPEDYDLLAHVVSNCGEDKATADYVHFLQSHPELLEINRKYERNEGMKKSLNEDKNVKANN